MTTARSMTSPRASGGNSANAKAEIQKTANELVATMADHRRATGAAFERGDGPLTRRLRRRGQTLTELSTDFEGARKSLLGRPTAAHMEAVRRIYEDLAELREKIRRGE